jgi:hypothetical protein
MAVPKKEEQPTGLRAASAELFHRGRTWTKWALISAGVVGLGVGVYVGWTSNIRLGAFATPVSVAVAYSLGRIVVRIRSKSWIKSLSKQHGVEPAKLEPVVAKFL